MRGDLMADGGNRIDLAAPLLSVRRGGGSGAEAAPGRGSALPFYKAELKSGPVRHPGLVPFVWEHRPGQPKAPAVKAGSSVRTRRAPPPPARPQPAAGQEIEVNSQGNVAEAAPTNQSPQGSDPKIPDEAAHEEVVVEAKMEAEKEEVMVATPVLKEAEDKEEEDDDERFSDALDTLSRTESFPMNCSVSGLSGMPDPSPRAAGAEPEARGFMMDRFLPAAQAVAVGSPQYTFRKATNTATATFSARDAARAAAMNGRTANGGSQPRRVPVHLPYQHLPPDCMSCKYPKHEKQEEEEEDDEDYDTYSTRGFAAKGCGLLPRLCMKSSLLLLNPVPTMKRCGGSRRGRGRGRGFPYKGRGPKAPSPLARSSQKGHVGRDSSAQSWEDVYKHKLEQKYLSHAEDGRSKLTSESNQLTWSDSHTADGSSPFRHSTGDGVSPYHSDVVVSPSHKVNDSVGLGDKDEKITRSDGSGSHGRDQDGGSVVGSDHGSLKRSGSMSSGVDITVHEDAMDRQEGIDSKASHLCLLMDTQADLNTSEHGFQPGAGQQVVHATHIAKGQENDSLTQKIIEVRKPIKLNDVENFIHDASQDFTLHLEDENVVKKEDVPLKSLLPLPVPKSPSESWLSRTLPSVTKNPPMPSFLGIQVQTKKQAPGASINPKKENDSKPSRQRVIQFVEVLEKPNSLDSQI